jgi:hypothetical protein
MAFFASTREGAAIHFVGQQALVARATIVKIANMMIAVAFQVLALGDHVASPELTQELTHIEQQLTETYKSGQCDAWGAWLAPEWSVTHITGAVITKADAIATCRAPIVRIDSASIQVSSVRTYGETAVVRGESTFVTAGDSPVTVRLRFTDVFVRNEGRWQIVASHATRISLPAE